MMSQKTSKPTRSITNPVFLASSIVLLIVLYIRVTRGLDLSDEMQYYGQIIGLIESGNLFTNDLFVQQTVYILFYPVLYLYHQIFGLEGLVFFSRLLMSCLSVVVFLYTYRKLLALKFPAYVAGITALSLSFAIPYHGIFAPSYNTISQMIWIVFALLFFEWKRENLLLLGILPVIAFFAHPTSALMMSFLILLRLLVERKFKLMRNVFLVFLGGGLVLLLVLFQFTDLHKYLTSLNFSSGYGVGDAFFSSQSQQLILLSIYALFGACLLFWKHLSRLNLPLVFVSFLAIVVIFSTIGFIGGAYNARVVKLLALASALAYCWSLLSVPVSNNKLRQNIHWLVVLLLLYVTTLGITSGNGMAQATGAFMVGLPLLLGTAVMLESKDAKLERFTMLQITSVILVSVLFMLQWSRYPYRENGWWRANEPIATVAEFKLLYSTPERVGFLKQMQHLLGSVTKGKKTLIVSEYPALYLALDTQPETCMLYMHSLTSDKSEKALLDCLNKKSPEVVIDILSNRNIAKMDSRIKNVMQIFYKQRGLVCETESISLHSSRKVKEQLELIVCKKQFDLSFL